MGEPPFWSIACPLIERASSWPAFSESTVPTRTRMIFAAYLALILALVWALSDGSVAVIQTLSPAARQIVRAATFALGLLIALASVAFLRNVASDHAFSEDSVPYLFFSALGIGGLIYAAGTALWRGATAQLLRAVGWTLIVLPMIFPSTLTLGLVLAAPLIVTVVTRIPRRGDERHPPFPTTALRSERFEG